MLFLYLIEDKLLKKMFLIITLNELIFSETWLVEIGDP